MKAAVLHGIGDIRVEDVKCLNPGPSDVLIRVHVCCVCGSDVRIFNHGNERVIYPSIIGHEMAGEVVEVGDEVTRYRPGDRICVGSDVPNMEESWGKNGMGNLCDINYAVGYQFPGGFAEYCLLNDLTLRYGPVARIPEGLPYEEAALAEPLACCINGLERSFLQPGKTVLIIGAGPIGILLARAAEAFGATLTVLVDRDDNRVRLAKESGVKNVFDSRTTSLRELDEGFDKERQGFDVILTACPSPEAHEEAIEVVAKRGVVNLFGGLPSDARKISFLSNLVHYKEAYITGAHGSTPVQHRLALDLISEGRIDVASLISHRFPLEKIEDAFSTVMEKRGLKVAVLPNQLD